MKLHEIKIKEKYFKNIDSYPKKIELKNNNENLKKGDLIRFIICSNDTGKIISSKLNLYIIRNISTIILEDKNYYILNLKKMDN